MSRSDWASIEPRPTSVDVPASRCPRAERSKGHRSVFLDFDPADGIPAGRDWEQELYRQMHLCRAVIVLCSVASMDSKWVFADRVELHRKTA